MLTVSARQDTLAYFSRGTDSSTVLTDTLPVRKVPMRSSSGDDTASPFDRIFPQSPQSQALARYGEYPVSMTTGVPDITIPIYDIKLGEYTLPINISYHASGIKMDEVATTVGLGWSLNAGGVITRSVNGAPDLEAYSDTVFYPYAKIQDVVNNPWNYNTNQIIGTDKIAEYDFASDRYTFNFAGRSGVFYYSYRDRCYIPTSYDKMYIEATPCSNNGTRDSWFYISDTKGNVYEFRQPEYIGIPNEEGVIDDVGAWYLTKIDTPYGNITFSYRMTPRYYIGHGSEEITGANFYNYPRGNERDIRYLCHGDNIAFETPVISAITWNGNRISFTYADDRSDIWRTRLTDIAVTSSASDTVKTVSLDNGHFWGNTIDNYRMMLHGISTSDEGIYSFTYNDSIYLPPYRMFNYTTNMRATPREVTDYWGYYNGKSACTLIPREGYRYIHNTVHSTDHYTETDFADRTPSATYTKLGVIRSIIYPTGGRTLFDFEGNIFGNYTAGGLRISCITSTDSYGNTLTRKSYSYRQADVPYYNPLHTMIYAGYFLVDAYPFESIIDQRGDYVCTSTPIFPLTNTPTLFYTEIWETNLNGDYTTYVYTGDPEPLSLDNYTTLDNFPIHNHTYTHDYGTVNPYLVEKTVSEADGTLKYREEYDYETVVAKNYTAGVRVTPIVKRYFSTGGESRALDSAIPNANPQIVSNTTILFDSITVHARVCRPVYKRTTDSNGVQTVEEYTYDVSLYTNNPKTVTHTNSDGRTHLTEYVYPFERSDEMALAMTEGNFFDEPIETTEYCNGMLKKATRRDYVGIGNFFYPEKYFVSLHGGETVERYRIMGYGNKGNITRMLTLGNDEDSITWDATEVYPLTHIRNGKTIAQYAWKPLVGVTQITAENGFATNYSYDGGGRLSGISDMYGLHNSFFYNYQNSEGAESSLANYVRSITYNGAAQGNPAVSYQYYDALGRPTHTRSDAVGGSGMPVYQFSRYDSKGRLSWQSLPASYHTDTNPDVLTPSDVLAECYADTTAYSSMTYDALDRLTFTSTAGREWHNAGKGVEKEYITNTANDVNLYRAPLDSISLVKSGYYPEHTLYGEKTTDEDGHILITYTDKLGQKVLERRMLGNKCNDTYYIYNDLGQLRYVLTPEYQNAGYKATYAYEYRYDGRGRMVKKILPQCGYVQYWYDKADRLTFMQDANLRDKGLYRFMLYDNMGRLCVQGLCSGCQRSFSGGYSYPRVTLSATGAGLLGTGYTLSCSGLLTGATLEKACYYDGYQFLGNGNVSPAFSTLTHTDGADVTGLQTGMIQSTSDGGSVATLLSYDAKGRVTKTSTSLPSSSAVNGREDITTTYTFTGQPQTTTQTVASASGTIFSVTQQNTYNAHNDKPESALLTITAPAGGTTSLTNTYDDLGRLTSTMRPQPVGNISYAYNQHGWTTDITTNSFTEKLHYTDGLGTPYYNGNISSQLWSNNTYKKNGANVQRGYRFTYDALDRMTDAVYGEGASLTDKANRYNETILSYTANGAIERLQRRGRKQDGEYGKIDNLNIQLDGNRIAKVTDDAEPVSYSGAIDFVDGANLSVEYTYDGNGNLTSDANKGISLIEYDDMNMPRRIQFTNGNVTEYVYTTDGQKLRTIHYTASTQQRNSTDYLLGGLLTRKNGTLDKYLFDGGYCSFSNTNTPTCHYYNRDHLGNIREVISQTGAIEQVTHYYPFGAPYSDSSITNPDLQPYKYNAKEFDTTHKLFTYDYGARQYDPLLIVWHGVDPLCEKEYATGVNVYCRNNPVKLIDSDGKDVIIWYIDKKGNDVYFRFDGTQSRIPNVNFVKDFVKVYNYLRYKGAGKNIMNAVKSHDIMVSVQEDADETRYDYNRFNHIISWQPRKGIKTTNGGQQSPATRLEHEFDHAIDNIKNSGEHRHRQDKTDTQYDNAEEKRVILGSERDTATKLGESTRNNHKGELYEVKDPRFTYSR